MTHNKLIIGLLAILLIVGVMFSGVAFNIVGPSQITVGESVTFYGTLTSSCQSNGGTQSSVVRWYKDRVDGPSSTSSSLIKTTTFDTTYAGAYASKITTTFASGEPFSPNYFIRIEVFNPGTSVLCSESKSLTVIDAPSCTNECSSAGTTACNGVDAFQICGNYDSDSCLEWGPITSCATNQICDNGNCITETDICDVEYFCLNPTTRALRNSDCSVTNTEMCSYGCQDGTCNTQQDPDPVCGDGFCEPPETDTSCSTDCGTIIIDPTPDVWVNGGAACIKVAPEDVSPGTASYSSLEMCIFFEFSDDDVPPSSFDFVGFFTNPINILIIGIVVVLIVIFVAFIAFRR